MHELALVRDMVDVVVESATQEGATQVKRVLVRVGRARDIVPSIFETAFAYLTKGTLAEGAELVVTPVPVTARCEDCGAIFPLDIFNRSSWVCPRCGGGSYKLHTGREFAIDAIEVIRAHAVEIQVA